MRTWFWTLLLTTLAVLFAVKLREYGGNVLILVGTTRIQVSLAFAVLTLLTAFVLLYICLRVLAWFTSLPERVRDWNVRRVIKRDHELLELGWTELLEGRYAKAEKDLTKLFESSRSASRQVLAALSAARAAHAMSEFSRRDKLLEQADQKAAGDSALQEAVASAAADLLLDQGLAEQALERLAALQANGARHVHTMRLLLRAHRQLNQHEKVFVLARSLKRHAALSDVEALQLIEVAAAARLRETLSDGQWREIWKALTAAEKTLPEIALAAAAAFDSIAQYDEASRVLEHAISVAFDTRLLSAYARADNSQIARRLQKAEVWLAQQPDDADLLTTLGVLCLNAQIWGQAERYLQRSVTQRDDARVHALLGSLYDRLGRRDEAARQWRQATVVASSVPTLQTDLILPAADTRGDPSMLPAEAWDENASFEAMARLHDTAPATPVTPSVGVTPAYDELDDYFDSAPIQDLGAPAKVTVIATPSPNPAEATKPQVLK
jgi:HemY protein